MRACCAHASQGDGKSVSGIANTDAGAGAAAVTTATVIAAVCTFTASVRTAAEQSCSSSRNHLYEPRVDEELQPGRMQAQSHTHRNGLISLIMEKRGISGALAAQDPPSKPPDEISHLPSERAL